MLARWLVASAMVLTAVAVQSGSAVAAVPSFDPAPCPPGVFGKQVDVTCGSIRVPERRARPHGRQITVAAAVVHAQAAHTEPDPIVFLDGGPSFGAISPFALGDYFKKVSFINDRDVILVDTRGTGLSRPRLGCPEIDRAFVASTYSKPYVDSHYDALFTKAVRACRNRLTRKGITVSAFTSGESAADLNDLRRALGYRRWNLLAISADGVLGLTYMRRFPERIRSAIIDSGQSVQMQGSIEYARDNTAVLEHVFAGCAANAACNKAYPDIRARFYELVDRLREHPAIIEIPKFRPKPVTLRVDGVFFYYDALFGMYPGDRSNPEQIHQLLDEIWRATHGGLAKVMRRRFGRGPETNEDSNFVAQGKTLSYVCHDIEGFVTPADIRQAAKDVPGLAPEILSPHYGLPDGPAGCRIWNVGVARPAQHRPVSSDIPTLVLAGELDSGGGVPAAITREIPKTLSHSFFYEFPASGHLQLPRSNPVSGCSRKIAAQFLDAPARRPRAGCIGKLPEFDFTPPPDGPRAVNELPT